MSNAILFTLSESMMEDWREFRFILTSLEQIAVWRLYDDLQGCLEIHFYNPLDV